METDEIVYIFFNQKIPTLKMHVWTGKYQKKNILVLVNNVPQGGISKKVSFIFFLSWFYKEYGFFVIFLTFLLTTKTQKYTHQSKSKINWTNINRIFISYMKVYHRADLSFCFIYVIIYHSNMLCMQKWSYQYDSMISLVMDNLSYRI